MNSGWQACGPNLPVGWYYAVSRFQLIHKHTVGAYHFSGWRGAHGQMALRRALLLEPPESLGSGFKSQSPERSCWQARAPARRAAGLPMRQVRSVGLPNIATSIARRIRSSAISNSAKAGLCTWPRSLRSGRLVEVGNMRTWSSARGAGAARVYGSGLSRQATPLSHIPYARQTHPPPPAPPPRGLRSLRSLTTVGYIECSARASVGPISQSGSTEPLDSRPNARDTEGRGDGNATIHHRR